MRALACCLVFVFAFALAACAENMDGLNSDPSSSGGKADDDSAEHVDIEGPDVLQHVQHFANEMCAATRACTIVTRVGHHPSAERAIDILVSEEFGLRPTDGNELGDRVAQFTLDHQPEHGVWYVIWRQRYNNGSGWDPMADRGGITANHYDHVHVSFNTTVR